MHVYVCVCMCHSKGVLCLSLPIRPIILELLNSDTIPCLENAIHSVRLLMACGEASIIHVLVPGGVDKQANGFARKMFVK